MDDVQKKAQEMTKKVTDSSMANPAEILAPNKPDPNLWAKGDEAPIPADNSNPEFLVPGKPANLWTNEGRPAEVPQGAEASENTEEQMYDSYGVPGESRVTTSSRGIIFDDEGGDYMATTHALQNQRIANVEVNEFGKLQKKYAKVDAYTRVTDDGLQVKLDTTNAKKALYEMIGQTTMPSMLDAPANRFWGYEYMPPEEERLEGWPTSVLRGAANMAIGSVAGAYGFVGQFVADIQKGIGTVIDDKDMRQAATNLTEIIKNNYDSFMDENYIHFNEQGDDSFENKWGVSLGSVVGSIALSVGTAGIGGATFMGLTEAAGAAYQARMGAMARGVDGAAAFGGGLLAGIGTGMLAGSSALVGRMLYKNRSWAAALAKEIAKRPNGRWYPRVSGVAAAVGIVDALSEPAQDMLSQYIADGELAGDWKDQAIVTAVVSLIPGLAITAANTYYTGRGVKKYMAKVDTAFARLAKYREQLEKAGFTDEDFKALKAYVKSEDFMETALNIARDKVAQSYDLFKSMSDEQRQGLLKKLSAIPNQKVLDEHMNAFVGRLNQVLDATDYSKETRDHIVRNLRAYAMLNLMFNGVDPSQMPIPEFLKHTFLKEHKSGSFSAVIDGKPRVGIAETGKTLSKVKPEVRSVQDENVLASEIVAKDAKRAARKSGVVDLSQTVTQSDIDHELWHFIEQNTDLPKIGEFMEEMKKFANEVLPGLLEKFDEGVSASEVYAYAMSYAKNEVLAKALGLSKDFKDYVAFLNAYVNVNENKGLFDNLYALQQEVLATNKDILNAMLEGAEEGGVIDSSVKNAISEFMTSGTASKETFQKIDAMANAMSGFVDQELAKTITDNLPQWVDPQDFVERWQSYRKELQNEIQDRNVTTQAAVTKAQSEEAAQRAVESAQEQGKKDAANGNIEITSAGDQANIIVEQLRQDVAATEKMEGAEEKPAEEKPAEEKPAEEKPVETKEEPVEEKPAETKEEPAKEPVKEEPAEEVELTEVQVENKGKALIKKLSEGNELTEEEVSVLRSAVDGWRGRVFEILKPYGTVEDLKSVKLSEVYTPELKGKTVGEINFMPYMESGADILDVAEAQDKLDNIFHNLTGKRTPGSQAEKDYFAARKLLYYITRANNAYRAQHTKNLINYSVHGGKTKDLTEGLAYMLKALAEPDYNPSAPTSFTDWANQEHLNVPAVPMTERNYSLAEIVEEKTSWLDDVQSLMPHEIPGKINELKAELESVDKQRRDILAQRKDVNAPLSDDLMAQRKTLMNRAKALENQIKYLDYYMNKPSAPKFYEPESMFYRPEDTATVKFEADKGVKKDKKAQQDEDIRMYEYLRSPEYKAYLLTKTPNAEKVDDKIDNLLDRKNYKKAKAAYQEAMADARSTRHLAEQQKAYDEWLANKEVQKVLKQMAEDPSMNDPETVDYRSEDVREETITSGKRLSKSGIGSKAGFEERIEGLKEGMRPAYEEYDDSILDWVQAKKSIDAIEKLSDDVNWETVNDGIYAAALTQYNNLKDALTSLYEREDSGLSYQYIKRVDKVIEELESARREYEYNTLKKESEEPMSIDDDLVNQRIKNSELSGSVYSYSREGTLGKSNLFRRAMSEMGRSLKGRWTDPATYSQESYKGVDPMDNPWSKPTGSGFRVPFNLSYRIFGNRKFNYLTNNGVVKSLFRPVDIEAIVAKTGVEITDDIVRDMCEISTEYGAPTRSELPNKKMLEFKIYKLMINPKNEVMPVSIEQRANLDAYNAAKKSLKVYTDSMKSEGVSYEKYKGNKDFIALQNAVESAKKEAGIPGVNLLSSIGWHIDNIIKGNFVEKGIYTANDLIYTYRGKKIEELVNSIPDEAKRKTAQAIVDQADVLADIYTTDAILRTKEYVDYLFDRAYPMEKQLVSAKNAVGEYLTLGPSVIDGTKDNMSVAEYAKSKEGKADLDNVLNEVRGKKMSLPLSAFPTTALKAGTKLVMPITMQDGKVRYTEATILSRNRSNNIFAKEHEFVVFVYKDGDIMRDGVWDIKEFIDLMDTDEGSVFVSGKAGFKEINELINTPVSASTNHIGYLKDYVNDKTTWGASKTPEKEGVDPTRDNVVKLINSMRKEQESIDSLFGMDTEAVYEEEEAAERTSGDIDEDDPDTYIQFSVHGGSTPVDFKALAQAIVNDELKNADFYKANKEALRAFHSLDKPQVGALLAEAYTNKNKDSLSSYFMEAKEGRTETRGKSIYEYGMDLYNAAKDRKVNKMAHFLTTGGNLDPQISSLFGEDRALDLNLTAKAAKFQAVLDTDYRKPRYKALQDIWGNSKEQKAEFTKWIQSLNDDRTDIMANIGDGQRKISTGEIMNLYAAKSISEQKDYEVYVPVTAGGNSYVWERFKQIYKNADELVNVLTDKEKKAVDTLILTTMQQMAWYTENGKFTYTVPVANRTKYEGDTWADRHSNVRLMSSFDAVKENSNICAGNFLELVDQQVSKRVMRENDYMSPIRSLADIMFFGERLDNNEYSERFKPGEMDSKTIEAMRDLSYKLNEVIREKVGQTSYNLFLKTIKGEVEGVNGLKLGKFGKTLSRVGNAIGAASLIGKPKHILTNGLGNYFIGFKYSNMSFLSYTGAFFDAVSRTKEAMEFAEKTRPDLTYRKETSGLSVEMAKLSDQHRETILTDLAKAMSSSKKTGLSKIGDFAYVMDGLMKKWTSMGIGVTNSFPDYLGQVWSNFIVYPRIVEQQMQAGMSEKEANTFAQQVLTRESATHISSSNPMAQGYMMKWAHSSSLGSSVAFKNDGLMKASSLGAAVNNLKNTKDPAARKALIREIEGIGFSTGTYVLIQAGLIEAAIQMLGGDLPDDEQRKYMVNALFRESIAQLTGSFVFGDSVQNIVEQIAGGSGTEGNIVVNALIKGGRAAVKGDILTAASVAGSGIGMSPLQFAVEKTNALMYLFGENPDVGARMMFGRTEGTAIKMAGKVKDKTTGEVREQKGEEE